MTFFGEALEQYAEGLRVNFSHADASPAQPEDQLKAPVSGLLSVAGQGFGLDVAVRSETVLSDLGVRPDLGVLIGGLVVGHVELKAPGRGANPKRFSGHDAQQWKRLRDHPNLVYTDGNEWGLYRRGEPIGRRVRFSGDVTVEGGRALASGDATRLEGLLRDFLSWQPVVPSNPRQLADLLAPLCRLLRETALDAVRHEGSALSQLASEWRQYLFPDADDFQFADAYAQTLTYALLLARFEGEADLHYRAAERLEARHGLLAQVLRLLTDPQARAEVEVPVSLLERTVRAVDPGRWAVQHRLDLPAWAEPHSSRRAARVAQLSDPWLYFYEDFLAAYDPKLRKNRGVYFTPAQVVSAQVALVSELLEQRFNKPLGLVDDEVVVLDPACGTGTYLLAAIRSGLELVRESFGVGAVASRAATAAQNFHGFEILVGPYAVSHLRFAQQVLGSGGALPEDGVHVYLTDTLDSPNLEPLGQLRLTLTHRKLAEERERARKVKAVTRVLVCLGNPPYYRQQIDAGEEGVEREGGWVRFGDDGNGGILRDFLDPAVAAGHGGHVKNLYNLYVYFWRWAIWKVLDSTDGAGVVSFITASSYLRGPGFVGMRRKLREVFDELWIIDLGGEGRGARRSENVFAIQTPVAIAVGVRYGAPDPEQAARVSYTRIEGTEADKLSALAEVDGFGSLDFEPCFDGWVEPLLPRTAGAFATWPLLTDLFPWQHSGAQFKRTWPIAPDPQILEDRWVTLLRAPVGERARLFHETRDRKVTSQVNALPPSGSALAPLAALRPDDAASTVVPFGYRSFDRQYAIADARLGDFLRPVLWLAHSPRQIYLTSLLTGVLGEGPAATVTALIPDLHHFRGSFGGKDVIPLWRDASASEPNVTAGVLGLLSATYGREVDPEALFAYCYALLASPDYVGRFTDELEVPGPRLPITKDRERFAHVETLGRQLIRLHTFGQRFLGPGQRFNQVPQGRARCTTPVPSDPECYPDSYAYDEVEHVLRVGAGTFAPVGPNVFGFGVSGLPDRAFLARLSAAADGREAIVRARRHPSDTLAGNIHGGVTPRAMGLGTHRRTAP